MTLGRNALINLSTALAQLALALVTIPLYIELIGPGRYGVLALAWIVAGYFGLFDMGLGRATTQRIAAMGAATRQERASVVWTAAAANSALGTGGGLVLLALGWPFLDRLFAADPALLPEVRAAMPMLAASVPLALLMAVFTGALAGRQRFTAAAAANLTGIGLSLLLPLAAAWLGRSEVIWLVAMTLAARLAGLGVAVALAWRDLLSGCRFVFDRGEWRRLLSFGGWIALSAMISPLILASDRMLIGATFGAVAVTAYTVPYQMAGRLLVFSESLGSALFPRIAAEADPERALRLSRDAQQATLLLVSLPVAALLPLVEPLLSLWLGQNFDPRSTIVGQIALVGVWVNGVAAAPLAHIQAQGNSRFTGLLHLAEIGPYIALLLALGHWFGLAGMCAAFALRCLADTLALTAKAFGTITPVLARLALPFVVVSTAGWLADRTETLAAQLGIAAAAATICAVHAILLMPAPARLALADILRGLPWLGNRPTGA